MVFFLCAKKKKIRNLLRRGEGRTAARSFFRSAMGFLLRPRWENLLRARAWTKSISCSLLRSSRFIRSIPRYWNFLKVRFSFVLGAVAAACKCLQKKKKNKKCPSIHIFPGARRKHSNSSKTRHKTEKVENENKKEGGCNAYLVRHGAHWGKGKGRKEKNRNECFDWRLECNGLKYYWLIKRRGKIHLAFAVACWGQNRRRGAALQRDALHTDPHYMYQPTPTTPYGVSIYDSGGGLGLGISTLSAGELFPETSAYYPPEQPYPWGASLGFHSAYAPPPMMGDAYTTYAPLTSQPYQPPEPAPSYPPRLNRRLYQQPTPYYPPPSYSPYATVPYYPPQQPPPQEEPLQQPPTSHHYATFPTQFEFNRSQILEEKAPGKEGRNNIGGKGMRARVEEVGRSNRKTKGAIECGQPGESEVGGDTAETDYVALGDPQQQSQPQQQLQPQPQLWGQQPPIQKQPPAQQADQWEASSTGGTRRTRRPRSNSRSLRKGRIPFRFGCPATEPCPSAIRIRISRRATAEEQ